MKAAHRCALCGIITRNWRTSIYASLLSPVSDEHYVCRNETACNRRVERRGVRIKVVNIGNPPRRKKGRAK